MFHWNIPYLTFFRIAKLLENAEPKTRGKNMFKLTEEEVVDFEKSKLVRKMVKHHESRKMMEEKVRILDKKVEKTKQAYQEIANKIAPDTTEKENQEDEKTNSDYEPSKFCRVTIKKIIDQIKLISKNLMNIMDKGTMELEYKKTNPCFATRRTSSPGV